MGEETWSPFRGSFALKLYTYLGEQSFAEQGLRKSGQAGDIDLAGPTQAHA